jgi:hypothetical protein
MTAAGRESPVVFLQASLQARKDEREQFWMHRAV